MGVFIGFVLTNGKVVAVAEHQSESIPLGEQRRNIEGVVVDGLAIVGGDGHHAIRCQLPPVHIELIEAEADHIGRGTHHATAVLQRELLAQIAGGHARVVARLLAVHKAFKTYPAPLPVALVEQGDTKRLRLTPRAATFVGHDLQLPADVLSASEPPAAIGHP